MERRAIGLETEFGCLVKDASLGAPEEAAQIVKDHLFLDRRLGLIDLHARDYAFEPARSGGFLLNGGRMYVDAVGDHEEYATPECISWEDLIAYDKAGQRLLLWCLQDLQIADRIAFYNNNIDHFGGHTFGCHENYAVTLDFHFFAQAMEALLPFLVTRQIFAGSGRVGGHRINPSALPRNLARSRGMDTDFLWIDDLYAVENDPGVSFQLSQRADHIVKAVSTRVRFNRAIINPKRDALGAGGGYDRLHILFGESNCSEYAGWLKVAATSLVLDIIEAQAAPRRPRIANPISALRQISRDASWRWIVTLQDGTTIPAVDVQRLYLAHAQRLCAGRDKETDAALRAWEEVLDGLEADPLSLADRLDWAAKFKMLVEFSQAHKPRQKSARKKRGGRREPSQALPAPDDMLYSLDMEYHNINPDQGLYYALEEAGQMRRKTTAEKIDRATATPPADTRAAGRARAIRRILARRAGSYAIDWDLVWVGKDACLALPDPHDTYLEEVEDFIF